ncbi:MAG TPA: hypothetical protein VFE05_00255 [Longimicrobiaceae bacterium]|jgi:hypothetical protein|nr:hypothetical protein [Longimicrobiaceae bacterium]
MTKKTTWRAAVLALAVTLAACASAGGRGRPLKADTWRWAGSVGGIGGQHITPEGRNLQVIYQFRSDSSLTVIHSPGTQDTTHFTIYPKGAPDKTRDLIRYRMPVNVLPPPQTDQYLRRIGRDTLELTDTCADCYTHTFVRVQ